MADFLASYSQNAIASCSTAAACSSEDVQGESDPLQDLERLIGRLASAKKKHRRPLQTPSRQESVSTAGGGGEPPNPRDHRNRSYGNKKPVVIFERKLKAEETILKKFNKVKGHKVKDAQLYVHQGKFYHLDTLHKDKSAHLEVYNRKGRHVGEANPISGKVIKGTADRTKKIYVK